MTTTSTTWSSRGRAGSTSSPATTTSSSTRRRSTTPPRPPREARRPTADGDDGAEMNRLAVLGQPIAHSLSPAMHTAAFEAVGVGAEWSYEAIELGPEEFADGVERLRASGFRGANVTVPHKV